MPNAWIAVAALVSATSAAWMLLFARGFSVAVAASVTVAGLAAFGVATRWGVVTTPARSSAGAPMKPVASSLWMSIVSLMACVAAFTAILVPQGFALKGLAWVTLALAAVAVAAAVVVRRSPRSLARVLEDLDREPALVPARAPLRAVNRKE